MERKLNYDLIPQKKRGRISKMPAVEQLAHDYASMSCKEVADKYGVPVATVKGWVLKVRRGEVK